MALPLKQNGQSACAEKFWPQSSYRVNALKDISFGHALNYNGADQEMRMDMYQPETDEARPLMIWLYGGGFIAGERSNVEYQCRDYASRGFVSVAPDYRLGWALNPEGICASDGASIYPAMHRAIQDVRAAVRFLVYHANEYKIDTSLIFIGGYSAGAILALQVPNQQEFETDPSLVGELGNLDEAVNDFPGPVNIRASVSFAGALTNKNLLLHGDKIPFIAFHGTCDDIVYFGRGPIFSCTTLPYFDGPELLAPLADSLGICNELHAFCGGTHNIWMGEATGRDIAFTFFRDKFVCGTCDNSSSEGIVENLANMCARIPVCWKDDKVKFRFQVFPVPSKGKVSLVPEMNEPNFISYSLYDRLGRSVNTGSWFLARSGEEIALDFEGVEGGLYYLQVLSGSGLSWTGKMIIAE